MALHHLWNDLRFALRQCTRRPGLSLAALFALACGLGGVTTAFTLVDVVILRPLPVASPSQLVWLRDPSFSFPVFEEVIRFEFAADGNGQWTLNGDALPLVEGALDIDLGFTPATNLLPIGRLNLAVGERADVRTAWVRFPELRVEALEQSYEREGARVFRYDALVDGERFQARLDTDDFGRVLLYEGLWEAEIASPSDERA